MNVCAVSDSMFEDALFGHVRGGFTGAVADAPGYLAEADRGTLFLDEIGGLPLPQQAKLLRVIETQVYRQVGGTRDLHSDFRLVSATNVPLMELIDAGAFRRDLARRLGGVVLNVPSLSSRTEDLEHLSHHFLKSSAFSATRVSKLTRDALAALQSHDWPENVRELRQVLECAVILSNGQSELEAAHIRDALAQTSLGSKGRDADAAERAELLAVLRSVDWCVDRAARRLGIHRTTLFRRSRRLGVTIGQFKEAERGRPVSYEQTA